jgi:23S rRNA G2445 N2-methylase RlmL
VSKLTSRVRPGKKPREPRERNSPAPTRYELEVTPGLEEFAAAELQRRHASEVTLLPATKPGNVGFEYVGNPRDLIGLRTAGAVYAVHHFAIPRPLALLGHQHLQQVLRLVRMALDLHSPDAFETFRISAAGEGTGVFERLRAEIANDTGLQPTGEGGDLMVRVRRALSGEGFEVSVRLSPRPLSARRWRVCDLPGALNASVARVMVDLTRPAPDDRYLNLACGSGTLIIERLDRGPAREVIGVDIDPQALACARANLRASGFERAARLAQEDAGSLPLPDASITALCGDLPFGHLVGSHRENELLYPRILSEAARVAAPGARMVLLTSEAKLFEQVLAREARRWRREREVRLVMDGVHLRMHVLVRHAAEGP